jgi:hypothetical protein
VTRERETREIETGERKTIEREKERRKPFNLFFGFLVLLLITKVKILFNSDFY